jgi:predicted HTH transcriptional regulator
MISSKHKSTIDDILKWKESSYLEFKRIHKKPKELLESIIALSNTE